MNFFGLVGEKLSHSVSPQIHKRVFEILNIESAYKNFEISKEDISKLDGAIKLLGIQGVNVTVPYKERIMKYLDFISPEAKRIGAVNTILLRENMLYGYNTDYFGLDSMFKMANIDVQGKVAVILVTGGASKAAMTQPIQIVAGSQAGSKWMSDDLYDRASSQDKRYLERFRRRRYRIRR